MSGTGIERLAVYPGSMCLPMRDLVAARGASVEEVCGKMMIDERSVNPPWEDPVTLAVNAAALAVPPEERASVGLLLVASETGPDQEKALSTWVQRYLDLPDDCRNCEVKIACYGGTVSLFLARGALGLLPEGRKVLVVTTDVSRAHFGQPYEFVMGCGAAAFTVSREGRFLRVDDGPSGVFTYEVSDLIRPTSRVEAGHSETSLLSYLEGIATTFERFLDGPGNWGEVRTLDAFRRRVPHQIYHAPFGGITERAHRIVHRHFGEVSPAGFADDFDRAVAPSLRYNRRMGGTYSASVFVSLLGLAEDLGDAARGRAVGIYSYGSGSCAEFFTATLGPEAGAIAGRADLGGLLGRRRRLSVAEYERAERERDGYVDRGDYRTDPAGFEDWFDAYYRGRELLVFRGCTDYVREYEWS